MDHEELFMQAMSDTMELLASDRPPEAVNALMARAIGMDSHELNEAMTKFIIMNPDFSSDYSAADGKTRAQFRRVGLLFFLSGCVYQGTRMLENMTTSNGEH